MGKQMKRKLWGKCVFILCNKKHAHFCGIPDILCANKIQKNTFLIQIRSNICGPFYIKILF